MKKTMNEMLSLKPKTLVLAGVSLLFLVGTFAWIRLASASSEPPLAQTVLEGKAILEAQNAGLQGTPTAQTIAQMTLGEWLTLNNAELGKDAGQFGLTPDMPVFVMAMRGNVESRLAGPPQQGQGQTAPEHYDNITVVLNARTGELAWIATTRQGFPMPVALP